MTASQITFGRVLRSEWTKLYTLRATWFVFGMIPQLLIGLSAIIGWTAAREPAPATPVADQAVGGGFLLFALAIGVFGVLMMTSEYGGGLIRVTLTAVPRRLPVLWAKALVLVAVTAPIMVAAYLLAFLANQAFVDETARLTLGDPHIVRAILGVAAATVAVGLLGLGIGTMVRHTAGAIAVFVAVIVLLPPVLSGALPAPVRETVLPYLPTPALQAMYEIDGTGGVLEPVPGTVVVLGWIVLALCGAAVMLRGRDA
ncbi:hypothetical protein [Nonomuraea sp. NPDC049141]|uniref:hypothetical protein n=1 Tax=unclassified Nonomuraea TaxID=2593643 RepID=UPI0033D50E08